jgi:hypothetical protein
VSNTTANPAVRFTQYHDVYALHKHMKEHLADKNYPSRCPHPLCETPLGSESLFWNHAVSVHGIPPFSVPRSSGKRKPPCDGDDDEGATNRRNSCSRNMW